MSFDAFTNWAFLGLVSGGVTILWQMNRNMSSLNTKLEVLVESHERAIDHLKDHEARIRNLEKIP